MKLLDVQSYATPADSKSHVRIPFVLDKPCDEMYIRFDYTPEILEDRQRALELLEESFNLYILPEMIGRTKAQADRYLPLKNLLTLSLDDEHGYRGACHRHDSAQLLFLSEKEASPGLIKGRIEPGNWWLTLSIDCIVTEACEYRLQIWTAEEDTP